MIRTNEEKFNVSSMYDENMAEYTVPVPDCDEETKKKAAQLAEDIEKKVTTNIHVAEERGQIVPTDMNEEDRLVCFHSLSFTFRLLLIQSDIFLVWQNCRRI